MTTATDTKALMEARAAVDAAIANLPAGVEDAVHVMALGVSLGTLRRALSSLASSETPPLPTREELIGYLAECYRATGSIQTAGCSDEEVAGHAVLAVHMLARRTQRGTYFDAESRTWVAREIVTSAGRTEEEAREALKSAIKLLAETWPPRASSETQEERPDLSEIARSLKRKAARSSPVPHEVKKDASIPVSLDDLTPAQRAVLERHSAEWQARLQPHVDAIAESQRITSDDLKLRIGEPPVEGEA